MPETLLAIHLAPLVASPARRGGRAAARTHVHIGKHHLLATLTTNTLNAQAKRGRLDRATAALVALGSALGVFTFSATANATTFHVSSTAQLEEAVSKANGDASANTIELAGGVDYQPTKLLVFSDTSGTQTLTGPAGTLTAESPEARLEGGAVKKVTGTSETELVAVKSKVTLDLDHVILTGGGRESSPAVQDLGTLNVEDSTIAANVTSGVAVRSGSTATLTNSTVAEGASVGLTDEGTLTLVNDTVTRNGSSGIGGTSGGKLNLTNTMVAENAKHVSAPECASLTFSTSDHDLASDETCHAELKNQKPKLSALLENDGGSTTLYSELPGSPTIAHGDPAKCPPTDQRGYSRPSSECDIGADQYSSKPPVITVPESIVVEGTGSTGAIVTYTVAASDSDGLVKRLECTPESGSTFPIGITEVICTATDDHENQASASFEVAVNEPPPGLTTMIGPNTLGGTPSGLAVNSEGHIWISEWSQNVVKEFGASGEALGQLSLTSPCTGQMVHPFGLALDSEGNLWVADSGNNRLLEFNAEAKCELQLGRAGPGTHTEFDYPTGVAIGPNGNLWVSDMFNQRIQELTDTGEFVRQFGKPGSFGSAQGELLLPEGLAVDGGGNVWVSEPFNDRVQEFDEEGEYLGQLGTLFPEGQAVAVGRKGNMWVVNGGDALQEFSAADELAVSTSLAAPRRQPPQQGRRNSAVPPWRPWRP